MSLLAIPDNTLKQIKVGSTNYDLASKYIINGEDYKTWSDIEDLVTAGFTIVNPWTKSDYESATAPTAEKLATVPAVTVYYNNGNNSETGTLAASAPEATKHIYLIYHPVHTPAEKDVFDEYISTGSAWEKIGNTDVDLSDYVKVGTRTTASGGATVTGEAGAGTYTTTSEAAFTATGAATITYVKADAVTGESGAQTVDTTNNGAITVQGSNFTFVGSESIISITTQEKELQDHSYTPAGNVTLTPTAAATITIHDVTGAELAATPTFTGEEAEISVSGTVSVSGNYDKVDSATGSAGAGEDANTGLAGGETVTGTASVSYKKAANVTGSEGEHTHNINTHNHADAVTAVSAYPNFSGGVLGGTTTFNTDAIKSASLTGDTTFVKAAIASADLIEDTAATPAFIFNTDAIKNAELTGTKTFNTDAIKSASLTGTKTFNTDAIKSISGTKNFGFGSSVSEVMYSPSVSEGVLTWSVIAAGTQDAHTGDAAGTGTVGIETAAASTGTVGISVTAASKKGVKVNTAAASTGTVGITVTAASTASVTFTAASLGTPSTVNAAGVASATVIASTAAGQHTHSIALSDAIASGTATVTVSPHSHSYVKATAHTHTIGTTSTAITSTGANTLTGTYTPAGIVTKPGINLTSETKTVATEGIKAVTATFTGTAATIAHSFGTASTVTLTASYTPVGTIGGSQDIASHTHSVSIASHTHSIGSTNTVVTGTAAVAIKAHSHSVTISNHTHSMEQHTHTVTLNHTA